MARRSRKRNDGCLSFFALLFVIGIVFEIIIQFKTQLFIILLLIAAFVFVVLMIDKDKKKQHQIAIQKLQKAKQQEFLYKQQMQDYERMQREYERETKRLEKEWGRLEAEFDKEEAKVQLLANEKKYKYLPAQDNPYIEDELDRVDSMVGRKFEFWCADLLLKCGYSNIVVTPGSGDFGADIICEKSNEKYAIQCKCYHSNLGNKPIQEIATAVVYYDCDYGIVMTNRRFTPGAKQLADKTNIGLCDRDSLIDILFQLSLQNDSIRCENCGTVIPSTVKFCTECGKPVDV